MDPENPRLDQLPEGVFYRAPETLPVLVERIVHERQHEKDKKHLSPPAGELTLRPDDDPGGEHEHQGEKQRHGIPPAKQFTPLDILPALSNAAMLGIFAYLMWTREAGIWAALGAFGLWLGVFIALRVDRPPQASQSDSRGILDKSDEPPIMRRTVSGDDAEQILEKFRRGEPLS